MVGLTALVIDDERPSLDEIAFLLRADGRIDEVLTSDSATDGLRLLHELEHQPDVVFLDIEMPGLSGLEQPAAWSVPLAFATMVTASRLTRDRVPPDAWSTIVRLHTPEVLVAGSAGAGSAGNVIPTEQAVARSG